VEGWALLGLGLHLRLVGPTSERMYLMTCRSFVHSSSFPWSFLKGEAVKHSSANPHTCKPDPTLSHAKIVRTTCSSIWKLHLELSDYLLQSFNFLIWRRSRVLTSLRSNWSLQNNIFCFFWSSDDPDFWSLQRKRQNLVIFESIILKMILSIIAVRNVKRPDVSHSRQAGGCIEYWERAEILLNNFREVPGSRPKSAFCAQIRCPSYLTVNMPMISSASPLCYGVFNTCWWRNIDHGIIST